MTANNNLVSALLCVLLFGGGRTSAEAAEPMTFYVSPEGSDLFTGQLARNDRARNDGPFATVQHARDVARAALRGQNAGSRRPVNIVLRGGTYWLTQPLILAPEDSGAPEAPVSWAAYQDEKPVLSAGRPIRGWGKARLNGHDVWAAKIPELRNADQGIHEFWFNGQRRFLARSPNQGFFHVAELPDVTKSTPQQQGQTRFKFPGEDLHNWPDIADAQVVVMSLWTESHLPVVSVDEQEHLVNFAKATVNKLSLGEPYYIEGAAELLDEPGEWYFDRKTGTIYYHPKEGETILGSQAVIPWHEQILRLEGDPVSNHFVHDVQFRGINFTNSEWDLPRADPPGARRTTSGFSQAAVGVPGAVWGAGVHDCVFEHCTVAHAGNYGLELAGGCQNNKISYCTFTDLGAGGIKIGQPAVRMADAERTGRNQITDCTIADCGDIFHSAVGVWLGQTADNLVAHNEIHGLWYTGISVGWTWGYGNSLAAGNIFEFNNVHHIGSPRDGVEPILSDMGGIYTLGCRKGTIVRHNIFHDIAGLHYGGWGIYFDEGTSDTLAEDNLVYNTTHGGFHQHYGAGNLVRNNIFAYARDAQIQRTREEDHTSFSFEHNIMLWDHGATLAGKWPKNVKMDYNTYIHPGGGDVQFAGKTWEQWQAAGMDVHSQFADDPFVDPKHSDFQFKPGAVPGLLGFQPFDVLEVGPRPHKR
jgi:parallel beta-helix repeat protein